MESSPPPSPARRALPPVDAPERPSPRAVVPLLVLAAGVGAVAWARNAVQVQWGAVHPLGLVWWALVLALLPRSRAALAVLALAVALRWGTFAPRLHLHFDRGWMAPLTIAGRLKPAVGGFGDTPTALLAWPEALVGPWPDAMHVGQAAISALTVPLLWGVVRALTGDRAAATVAAVIHAALPIALVSASSDTRFVDAAALELAAVLGLARADRSGDLLAAVSLGLLAHLRPELPAFAVVLLVAALARRQWLAAAVGGALVAWRLLAMAAAPPGGWNADAIGGAVGKPWLGVGGALLPADPTLDPVGVSLLAAVGAVLALRRGGGARLALLGLVVTMGPYVYQWHEADRIRYHLIALPWLAALAGVGASALARRSRPLAGVALLLAAASWAPTARVWTPFAWSVEYGLAREALLDLPQGTVVRFDDALDPHGQFAAWLDLYGRATAEPLQGPLRPGELRWVGMGDYARLRTPDLTGLRPRRTLTFDARLGDMDYGPFAERRPTIGLYAPE